MPDMRPDVTIVLRGGTVFDGQGGEPFVADVAIDGDRIVAVESGCLSQGAEEIDATGLIVTPGFVDIHTHYDGQAIWSSTLTPSSLHGVTTVVMGNCGVGFAPCRAEDREMLVHVMEGVEDIPEIVMTSGLSWEWETFPDFLCALEKRPRDISVLAYVPHSALRVYAMGERGTRREPATEADLAAMRELAREAVEAGAIGFSTSNVTVHRTRDGDHIPSFGAAREELMAIAEGVRQAGRGVLQILLSMDEHRPGKVRLLADLSKRTGLAVTFTLAQINSQPDGWREVLDLLDAVNAEPGVRVKAQVFPRPIGMILSHALTLNPFRLCPSYQPIAALPLEEKLARLRDPALRAALLAETPADPSQPLFVMSREFGRIFELGDPPCYEPAPDRSIAARAAAMGIRPEELAYDLLLEKGGHNFLLAALSNYPDGNLDATCTMLRHPHCIPGLGDGGAHYGLICDSSYTTFLLTHWARDRDGPRIPLPEIVAALTSRPAALMGLADRGIVAPGLRADLNLIDPQGLRLRAPYVRTDLPGGGRRIMQEADGYVCTIVGGEVISRGGVQSAARPGQLVRSAIPA